MDGAFALHRRSFRWPWSGIGPNYLNAARLLPGETANTAGTGIARVADKSERATVTQHSSLYCEHFHVPNSPANGRNTYATCIAECWGVWGWWKTSLTKETGRRLCTSNRARCRNSQPTWKSNKNRCRKQRKAIDGPNDIHNKYNVIVLESAKIVERALLRV